MSDFNVVEKDILVIGSGGTGCRAAIEASDQGLDVMLVNKGYSGKSGSTVMADADLAIDSRSAVELFGLPGNIDDSQETFFEDMIIEGEYINNQRLVETHVSDAPEQLKRLVDWGAKIRSLTRAPGHSYPRGLWIPGREISRILKAEVNRRNNIDIFEHLLITDLIIEDDQLNGALGLDLVKGKFYFFQVKAAVITTGGAARLYPHATAAEELTGDGLAMAYRAGVELVDMEFPMFLPYTLINPPALKGVIFPFDLSAYLNVKVLNREGTRYMRKWDPERLEKSTRDINSVAAAMEIREGRGSPAGGTYLSLTHLPENLLSDAADWLPDSISNWRYGGFNLKDFFPDLTKEALETAPACHFWNGGIKINKRCETNIPGLFAAGEGTGGIHGANRISGNAMTQTQVWGARAGSYAACFVRENQISPDIPDKRIKKVIAGRLAPLEMEDGVNPFELRDNIMKIARDKAGVIREKPLLKKALEELQQIKGLLSNQTTFNKERIYNKEWASVFENENLINNLEMVIRSSLLRNESRGALYRIDFPETNNKEWLKNIIISRDKRKMDLNCRPVEITSLTPPQDIREYGLKRVKNND